MGTRERVLGARLLVTFGVLHPIAGMGVPDHRSPQRRHGHRAAQEHCLHQGAASEFNELPHQCMFLPVCDAQQIAASLQIVQWNGYPILRSAFHRPYHHPFHR